VLGAPAAAAAVGAALGLSQRALVDALGIAGSMASGIIEYLAEGAWTKRMHAGWAAQSGLRAALLARSGFVGPRTVLEGEHGLFRGFARTGGDIEGLSEDLGSRWLAQTVAFKPYPCGTMTHPYIDCARRLAARGIAAQEIVAVECEVAEGTVHRLWEPLAAKQRPPNGYAGKFSTPYCIAAGFLRGELGLDDFSDVAVQDPAAVSLASRVRYRIDPENPYPRAFTGHARAVLADGRVIEERQPHLRGGVHEPLTGDDIEAKLRRNTLHGGVDDARTSDILARLRSLYDADAIDLSFLRG
jgi:2-methylcitrate dehydratase PrpD